MIIIDEIVNHNICYQDYEQIGIAQGVKYMYSY